MIDNNVNPNVFPLLKDHKDAINSQCAELKLNISKNQRKAVKSSISNTKNISVKLNDLRTAQDHGVAEFGKGMFNMIGGSIALAALAAVQLVCFVTVIPAVLFHGKDSAFLPDFSEMANLVARGASRVANACQNIETLHGKIDSTVAELNDELENLPNNINNLNAIRESIDSIHHHINEIKIIERENGIKVDENMPTKTEKTGFFGKDSIRAPRYDALMTLDAEKVRFVELVKELTSIAASHFNDLNEELQASIDAHLLEENDEDFNSDFEINVESDNVEDENNSVSDEALISDEDESVSDLEAKVEVKDESNMELAIRNERKNQSVEKRNYTIPENMWKMIKEYQSPTFNFQIAKVFKDFVNPTKIFNLHNSKKPENLEGK